MVQFPRLIAEVVKRVSGAAALICMLWVSSAGAQDGTSTGDSTGSQPSWAESKFSITVTSYLWLTSLSGDIGVGGLPPADVDITFGEIFKNIDWFPPPIMLAAEARYERFGFLTDFIYLGTEDEGNLSGPLALPVEADLKTMILTFGGAYRVVQSNAVDLDLLAGGRLWMMDANVRVSGPFATRQVGGSKSWMDPIVGVVGHVRLGGGFSVRAEGDVGGFGLGADLDWQVLGTLQYQLDDSITLQAGYRYLAVDYDDGGFVYDVALQGPLIGGSIRF
jgi:hypothetical protein